MKTVVFERGAVLSRMEEISKEVGREVPTWISVRESLPKPYTIVCGLYRALGEWVEVTTAWHKDRWQPDLAVEYWIPLPELPPFRQERSSASENRTTPG